MSKIVVVKNPSQEQLDKLGVSKWAIWEKEVSKFPIDFGSTECAYVLEGEILVTPKGGEPVRIVAGVAVSGVSPSFWLLAFSMFLFFSLASLKRYVEIASRAEAELEAFSARAYRASDTQMVAMLGIGSGLVSVLVLAFYLDSREVMRLYANPGLLWLACPLLLMHSPQDDVVPFAMGRRLFAAARGPKTFVELRGGHNDAFLESGPDPQYRGHPGLDVQVRGAGLTGFLQQPLDQRDTAGGQRCVRVQGYC